MCLTHPRCSKYTTEATWSSQIWRCTPHRRGRICARRVWRQGCHLSRARWADELRTNLSMMPTAKAPPSRPPSTIQPTHCSSILGTSPMTKLEVCRTVSLWSEVKTASLPPLRTTRQCILLRITRSIWPSQSAKKIYISLHKIQLWSKTSPKWLCKSTIITSSTGPLKR